METPAYGKDHHVHIDSKYCDLSEINELKLKEKHLDIIHLNIASLNKHTDNLRGYLQRMSAHFLDILTFPSPFVRRFPLLVDLPPPPVHRDRL